MIAAALALALSAASAANCLHAAGLRTVDRDPAPLHHHFQNGTARPLTLWWVDREGKRVASGTIAPGKFASIQTWRGHAFVLTSPRGTCRAAVRVDGVLSGTYVGTSRYRATLFHGWHLFVDRDLDLRTDVTRTALATLAQTLEDTEKALPPAALAKVRITPIFLLNHSGPGGMYHYSPDWLTTHGRTVDMARAIEISDATMFLDTVKTQPWAVFHELAHSYLEKLTDAERADVEAIYRQAVAKGLYAKVKRVDGWEGPAYASSNAFEYFAEASEAYFGRNDFFPFTRAELETYDPAGAALMARLWR